MKTFLAILPILAAASANQHSHQTVKHGNAPTVHTSVHRPHGSHHSTVVSQPSAQPHEVHQAYNEEKYAAAAHAPAHKPVHAPAYHHAAPVHHAHPHAPAYHATVHAPAYHAPVHGPAYHAPAPAYKAPYSAPYHAEPAYDGPAVYNFAYAVNDDYSGVNFAANEARDNYATNGEYRVALPDGRTQIVTYNVADAYSGYVADVRYEGEAHYEPHHPKPAYAPHA